MENNEKDILVNRLQKDIIEMVKRMNNIRYLGITRAFLYGLNKKQSEIK